METVIFENQTWEEIDHQDNPAMQRDREEGLMIFKGKKNAYQITKGGFLVAFFQPNTDITRLGVFWRLENAVLFAESYKKSLEVNHG